MARLLFLALLCGIGERVVAAEPRPPNVVIIYADDLGYGDLGCYGNTTIRTPNLDRMAREGMRFTDFYVAQAVCSASRAALLTGCYPNRIGIQGALGPSSRHGIHEAETTLGEMLQRRGYATAVFGKWHLGHHPQFLPTKHGFNEYYGLPYSNDMWPKHPTAKFPDLPLIDGEKIVALNPDQSRLIQDYTARAIAFISKHKHEPFFVYVPHSMPHVPLFASAAFRGRSAAGLYGDVIEELDDSVGRILAALKEQRLDEQTLVMFASDNGPWISYGNHAGTAGKLREAKGTSFEGGVRVPCLFRWPGHVLAGHVCREPTMTVDILPTLALLTGATLPERRIDGSDLCSLLTVENARAPDRPLFFYWDRELQAIRWKRWKLHLQHEYRTLQGEPGRDGQPGPYVQAKIEQSLFDLENDPTEKTNVAAEHPDVVQQMLTLVEAARVELGDTATARKGNGVREPGRLME